VMNDVVTIAPLCTQPGLVAYECPDCGYLTSRLLESVSISEKGKQP
jgi:hypothetical protein